MSCPSLQPVCRRLVEHCLKVYARRQNEDAADGEATWALDDHKARGGASVGVAYRKSDAQPLKLRRSLALQVCLYFARRLLAQKTHWRADDFMDRWQEDVPDGMAPSLDQLRVRRRSSVQPMAASLLISFASRARVVPVRSFMVWRLANEAVIEQGEVIFEAAGGADMTLKAFSASSLPRTPAERFAALFRERRRWEFADLEPYLHGIEVRGPTHSALHHPAAGGLQAVLRQKCPLVVTKHGTLQAPGQSAEALLLKYARASQQRPTDSVSYSARA